MPSRKPYTKEFKLQAMNLVRDKGYSISHASRELNMPLNTLSQWLNKAGWKFEPEQLVEPSTDVRRCRPSSRRPTRRSSVWKWRRRF